MFRLCCATLSRNSIANDNQRHGETTHLPFALSVFRLCCATLNTNGTTATESKCWQRFDSALPGYAQRERGIGSLYAAQETVSRIILNHRHNETAQRAQTAAHKPVSSPRLASPAARLSELNTNGL
jgi:hypothetical protein